MAMVRLPTSLDNTSDRTALSCPVPCLDVHLPSFHPAKFSPPHCALLTGGRGKCIRVLDNFVQQVEDRLKTRLCSDNVPIKSAVRQVVDPVCLYEKRTIISSDMTVYFECRLFRTHFLSAPLQPSFPLSKRIKYRTDIRFRATKPSTQLFSVRVSG